MQGHPFVQLVVWAGPDGWRECPYRALFPFLGLTVSEGKAESEETWAAAPAPQKTTDYIMGSTLWKQQDRITISTSTHALCTWGRWTMIHMGRGGRKGLSPWNGHPTQPAHPAMGWACSKSPHRQGPYMSESSELDSSPWPSDFQRL